MKVYLASSFKLKEKVQCLSDMLESKGVVITRKWWFTDFKTALGDFSDQQWYAHEKIKWLSQENFTAIDRAEAVILVCPDETPHEFTGANIEVGYAIAKGKRVFAVGTLGRSAMYTPVEKVASFDDLLTALKL